MNFELILINYGYYALFFLMVLVGILGIFPPSKIIYIFAGYFAFSGELDLFFIFIIGALGHSIGNYVQYEVARQKGEKFIYFLLKKYPLFPISELKKLKLVFKKKGLWFLFVGKLLDPIKLVISLCAGFSKINRFIFLFIVYITSYIWAMIFTLIGYFFGTSLEKFGWIGIIILILGIIVISQFYKYMNSDEIIKELER